MLYSAGVKGVFCCRELVFGMEVTIRVTASKLKPYKECNIWRRVGSIQAYQHCAVHEVEQDNDGKVQPFGPDGAPVRFTTRRVRRV